ncbi:MAG: hypothetical protein ACRDLR_06805, partial [Gaiellaceae bacterium]
MRVRRTVTSTGVIAATASAVAALAAASTATVRVIPSKADLYYAGLTTVPHPGVQNGGRLPVLYPLPGGTHRVLEVTATRGKLNWGPGSPNFGADGDQTGNTLGGVTNIDAYRGLSGIRTRKDQLFLAGVFLGRAAPAAPAPARLSQPNASSAARLSPRLRQVFPIGDGHTNSGTVQRFVVPAGATRLYLGYTDADGFHGPPGFYDDNTG